ncbi:hypothetical protein AN958_06982 [Leucoagaricus sp. SymC.cos]|nr:hypothetical protein AN958_06982 [Leucoagaricus sp. SymC.cos]
MNTETPLLTKYRHKPHLLRSPVPHLLQSNKSISEEECNLIRNAITRVHAEVALLEEIESAEPHNEMVYRRRLACEEFLANHEALFHWTRRLPPELLINIFLCFTESGSLIPWKISHVCRKWRSLALKTPELWRKVPLKYLFLSDKPLQRHYLQFLRDDYLKRSKNETIAFAFRFGHASSARLYPILLEHVERWGDVRLGIHQNGAMEHISTLQTQLAGLKGRLRSLYSLKIIVAGSASFPLDVFKSAPRLKYLVIDSSDFWNWDMPLQVGWPWNQVTHFGGEYLSMELCDYLALTQFTNLVYINLCNFLQFESPFQETTITFSACRYLSLEIYKGPATNSLHDTNFLKSIHCPLLERVHISYYVTIIASDVLTQVAKLVQRHAEQLTGLHWQYDTPVPSHSAILSSYNTAPSLEMAASLNNLQILRITEASCSTLVHFLQFLSREPVYLPSLCKLDIMLHLNVEEDEAIEFCQLLRQFVHDFERHDGFRNVRKFSDIRLEVPRRGRDSSARYCMSRWDVIMQLEGWTRDLQQGWEKQTRLEDELKQMSSWANVLKTAINESENASLKSLKATLEAVEECNVTDALVLHGTRIYFILREMSKMVLSQTAPTFWKPLDIMEREDRLLKRWTPLLIEDGPTRRWTTAGPRSIIYIPPHSSLRGDPLIWILGAEDNCLDPGYITEELRPGIDDQWKDYDEILRRFSAWSF